MWLDNVASTNVLPSFKAQCGTRKGKKNICKKGKTKCGNRTEKKNICENGKKIFKDGNILIWP